MITTSPAFFCENAPGRAAACLLRDAVRAVPLRCRAVSEPDEAQGRRSGPRPGRSQAEDQRGKADEQNGNEQDAAENERETDDDREHEPPEDPAARNGRTTDEARPAATEQAGRNDETAAGAPPAGPAREPPEPAARAASAEAPKAKNRASHNRRLSAPVRSGGARSGPKEGKKGKEKKKFLWHGNGLHTQKAGQSREMNGQK